MESLLRNWNGESVIIRFDRPSGAWIIIAIHSTFLGPAIGGTRMKSYPNFKAALEDALQLAASMTYKFAAADFPSGGGKAVIALPFSFDIHQRPSLLRHYGTLLKQLGGLFQAGPDVGTSPADMDIIAETGAPFVFCRTPEKGGAGGSGKWTALGVFSGMQAVCKQLFDNESLRGRVVMVQGTGSVGHPLIELLLKSGAEVLFSEVNQTAIQHFRDKLKFPFVPPERVYDTPCDIFAPCALGGILNRDTIPRLKCIAIAGAANNQLAEPTDAMRLVKRNILYAPDYVISVGGAMAIIGIEKMGWSLDEARAKVNSIKQTMLQVFKLAKDDHITTDTAAKRIVDSRLSRTESN